MPTATVPISVQGEDANFSVVLPSEVGSTVFVDPGATQWIAFNFVNNGNVGAVINFDPVVVDNGGTIVNTSNRAGTSDFESGDTLAPGKTLEVKVQVSAPDAGIGETVQVTASLDYQDPVQA